MIVFFFDKGIITLIITLGENIMIVVITEMPELGNNCFKYQIPHPKDRDVSFILSLVRKPATKIS